MDQLIQKAARDLLKSRHAIALTGAGISTESGIPDFRGPNGLWTKNPEAERKAYQSYELIKTNPVQYWEDRLSGALSLLGDLEKYDPNPGHLALVELEKMGILKWVITQNIDNLHRKAGTKNILEYHGNAFRLRCMACNSRYDPEDYNLNFNSGDTILNSQRNKYGVPGIELPPRCKECGGIVKSDIVHFGEAIPPDMANQSLEEASKCDVMLICGTSAVVYPFAMLPRIARERTSGPDVTIIELNAERTPLTGTISDYLIKGKTGEILPKVIEELQRQMT